MVASPCLSLLRFSGFKHRKVLLYTGYGGIFVERTQELPRKVSKSIFVSLRAVGLTLQTRNALPGMIRSRQGECAFVSTNWATRLENSYFVYPPPSSSHV